MDKEVSFINFCHLRSYSICGVNAKNVERTERTERTVRRMPYAQVLRTEYRLPMGTGYAMLIKCHENCSISLLSFPTTIHRGTKYKVGDLLL